VVTGRQPAAGGRYRYEVRDAGDLGRLVWQGVGTSTGVVLALEDRALVATPAGTVQVDPATGAERPWGTRLDRLVGVVQHDGLIVSPSGSAGGFTARDEEGRVRWTSDADLGGASTATRSCLVVTDVAAEQVSCLDWSTSETRWTRARDGATSVDGLVGQTDDAVFAASTTGASTDATESRVLSLRTLDGATGTTRAVAELPGGAVPAAAGRTVGYALAYGSSGGRSTVVAFDLASGERLWVYPGRMQVAFWGGRLIDVDVDGVAHELVDADRPRVVGQPLDDGP